MLLAGAVKAKSWGTYVCTDNLCQGANGVRKQTELCPCGGSRAGGRSGCRRRSDSGAQGQRTSWRTYALDGRSRSDGAGEQVLKCRKGVVEVASRRLAGDDTGSETQEAVSCIMAVGGNLGKLATARRQRSAYAQLGNLQVRKACCPFGNVCTAKSGQGARSRARRQR